MSPTHDPTEHEDEVEDRLAQIRKEATEQVLDELDGGAVNARASDASVTFSNWLRALTPELQDYVLGHNRAEVLRRNPHLRLTPNTLIQGSRMERGAPKLAVDVGSEKRADTGVEVSFAAERVPYGVWMALQPTHVQEESLGVAGAVVLRESFQRFIRQAAELLPQFGGKRLDEKAKAPAVDAVGHTDPHVFVRRPMPPADLGAHPTASSPTSCYLCGEEGDHSIHIAPVQPPRRP